MSDLYTMKEAGNLTFKPSKYLKINFDKVTDLKDLLLIFKVLFDGTTVADCHKLFDELKEKGLLHDAT